MMGSGIPHIFEQQLEVKQQLEFLETQARNRVALNKFVAYH